MSKEMLTYLTYLKKTVFGFKTIMAHPLLLTPVFGLVAFGNETLAILLLIMATAFDYGTGVYASWVLFKKNPEDYPNGWYTSEKWRLSITKCISYSVFILLAYAIEKTFLIKKIHVGDWTDTDYSLTLIAIGICVGIEFYSIIWENLPKAGFDLPGKATKALETVKSFLSKIKDFKNGGDSST